MNVLRLPLNAFFFSFFDLFTTRRKCHIKSSLTYLCLVTNPVFCCRAGSRIHSLAKLEIETLYFDHQYLFRVLGTCTVTQSSVDRCNHPRTKFL